MKRHIKTALLGIFLLSGFAASASAQHSIAQTIFSDGIPAQISNGIRGSIGTNQIPGINSGGFTDMRYRGNPGLSQPGTIPVTDAMYRGPHTGQPQPTPHTDTMYRGNPFQNQPQPTPYTDMRYRGPINPVVTPNPGGMMPNLPIQGGSIGIPGTQHQFNPINSIPQGFQTPQPQSMNLLQHNVRHNIVGGSYNDGRGGSMHGSIGTIEEANLGLVSEPDFAGVRGGARGGISAQGQVRQIHDINGVPIHQTASGNVFLGAEANAQAGLSHEGLGAGAGGFVGARAQLRRGVEVGGVNVGQTVEGQVGIGAEANAHLGLQNGRLRINGELGAAVGVGAKVGVDAEVDFRETGQFVEKHGSGVIRDVGNSAKDVNRWSHQAGRDISRTTNNASNSVKRTVNKTGNDVKKTANKVGGGIKKFGNSLFGK